MRTRSLGAVIIGSSGVLCSAFGASAIRSAMQSSIMTWAGSSKFDLILASASPRRREILSLAGVKDLRVIPSTFEEDLPKGNDPGKYAALTALEKAREVAKKEFEAAAGASSRATLCIGADTIVALDNGEVLEKPDGVDGAKAMLRSLSGGWHSVYTGVALFSSQSATPLEPVALFNEQTRVKFIDLTDDDIAAYIATGEPMDKAGAYGIQGIGGQMVEKIDGCFFNVAGLPLSRLSTTISKLLSDGKVL